MFCGLLLEGRGSDGEAGGEGAVGGVAHEAVEDGPGWTEEPGWWVVRGTAEGEVGVLCVAEF